jgi:hypothetical protein
MHPFSNDREALDFIASQIADQARRDGVPLSDVERKMLYFSETERSWLPPLVPHFTGNYLSCDSLFNSAISYRCPTVR